VSPCSPHPEFPVCFNAGHHPPSITFGAYHRERPESVSTVDTLDASAPNVTCRDVPRPALFYGDRLGVRFGVTVRAGGLRRDVRAHTLGWAVIVMASRQAPVWSSPHRCRSERKK
jgi:hypothetical protein